MALRKFIDEEIFTKLNRESAFLLGFIFTDGFLRLNDKTGEDYVKIFSKDRYKIENVKKIFLSEHKIQHIKEKVNKGIKQGELFFLRIANPIIIEDLIDLGMSEKKNENIRFPYLTENLYPHFIRGVLSGSGSVSIYKKSIISQFTIGSIEFITELEKFLNSKGLNKRVIYKNKKTKKPSFVLRYSVRDTKLLFEYLYDDANELTTDLKQKKILEDYFLNREINNPISLKVKKRKMKRIKS